MLWIEQYRPRTFGEMVGQERVVARLAQFAEARSVPHLLLSGPPGTGKSVRVECLAAALYGDRREENLAVVNAADLFTLGRRYLEEEERYAQLYRKDESVLSNFKRIIRWQASLQPFGAGFKLIAFEGAAALPREAQQALRRIMERYTRTCRFIFCTSRPSAIIPAVSSRCFPFFFAPIPHPLVERHLLDILDREYGDRVRVPPDTLDLLITAGGGDLRRSIMLLQVAAGARGQEELPSLARTEAGAVASALFSALASGDVPAAIRRAETLMVEYGLSGQEVLKELRAVVKREYNLPRLADALGETDFILGHCNNEYLQVNALLARMAGEIAHARSPREGPAPL